MRAIFAVAAICCTITTAPSRGEELFPYKGTITADEVYVRSGPGQSYYPTDKLKANQEVEVYRHDPGGWFAIRPVKGSFSWVSDRYLQPGKDDLAIVSADGVASRVGSRFSDIRDVIQVRLHKGEVVEVLDCVKTGSRKWYKITPPSGEFRWIAGKYVDSVNDDTSKAADKNAKPSQDEPAAFVRQRLDKDPAQTDSNDTEPTAEGDDVPAFQLPLVPRDNSTRENKTSSVHRVLTPEQFQTELEDIDLKLAAMVAEEPTVWSFDAMRQRAREMFNLAETAVERGRARRLMNRLANFADIKRRYSKIAAAKEKVDLADRRLSALRQPEDSTPLRDPLEDRFDGVGQLTEIVSPKAGAPRFALLDKRGEVRCYVSPAPGVNLRHYLGRYIGVTGNRGYMPEQRAHHVMARHVNLVEGRMW